MEPAVVEVSSHPDALSADLSDEQIAFSEEQLVENALSNSPDLLALRTRLGVARAQLYALGVVPDPQLSLSADRPSGSGFVDALNAGLSLDIASLLTLGKRREVAEAAAEQVRLDVAWVEWLTVNQVRTLARRQSALELQVALADEAKLGAQEVLRRAEASLEQGDLRIDDVSLYRVGFLDATDRALGLQRALVATRGELLALVGMAPDGRVEIARTRTVAVDTASLAPKTLAARAFEARLDLAALREGYAAQEASIKAARLAGLPLPQLSLNRARDSGALWSRGIGLGFSLPLWNRNRGEIEVSLASRTQLAAEYRARLHQARADIAALCAELQGLDTARQALATQLPSLEQARDSLAEASRDGSVPVVTYEAIRAALLDKQLALLGIEQALAEGQVALEVAVGDFIWEHP